MLLCEIYCLGTLLFMANLLLWWYANGVSNQEAMTKCVHVDMETYTWGKKVFVKSWSKVFVTFCNKFPYSYSVEDKQCCGKHLNRKITGLIYHNLKLARLISSSSALFQHFVLLHRLFYFAIFSLSEGTYCFRVIMLHDAVATALTFFSFIKVISLTIK